MTYPNRYIAVQSFRSIPGIFFPWVTFWILYGSILLAKKWQEKIALMSGYPLTPHFVFCQLISQGIFGQGWKFFPSRKLGLSYSLVVIFDLQEWLNILYNNHRIIQLEIFRTSNPGFLLAYKFLYPPWLFACLIFLKKAI